MTERWRRQAAQIAVDIATVGTAEVARYWRIASARSLVTGLEVQRGMGLIDLRDVENPEPYVGWADDDGQILARARMRRTDSSFELLSITTSDVEIAVEMVRSIAEVASASRIVTSLSDPWLAERCGFVDGVLELRSEVAARPAVAAFTLSEVEAAITSSWCAETSPLLWTEDNPARGQCDVTAPVRELLGGSILCCNVLRNGERVERHAWNLLDSGLAIDLTRRQYDGADGIEFEPPVVQEPYEIGGLAARADLLLKRVRQLLGES